MASFMDSVSKGLTAINVKTNNFMEENKCKTYITTLEGEIAGIKQQIGEIAYSNYKADKLTTEDLTPFMVQIDAKYQEIQKQKERIEELAKEEQQILGKQQEIQAQQNVAGPVTYCPKCGTANAANYKFCSKCGTPLAK